MRWLRMSKAPSMRPQPGVSEVSPWLRAEGMAALLVALMLYAQVGGGWLLFALLFLVPDLSMLGYLSGPRLGAHLYNAVHSYVGALLLGGAAFLLDHPLLLSLNLIWVAHIGGDRALGYGLKFRSGFQDTHLGRIGRR